MRIAEIAIPVSIACDTTFDYIIPKELPENIPLGSRVLVPLRQRRVIGYLTGLKARSRFQSRLRPILRVLDTEPLLTPELILLAKKISDTYLVSLADGFDCVLPSAARTRRKPGRTTLPTEYDVNPALLSMTTDETAAQKNLPRLPWILIHDEAGDERWSFYAAAIKETLSQGQGVIALVPDHRKIKTFLNRIRWEGRVVELGSHRSAAENLAAWTTARSLGPVFVVGPRSAVFAPLAQPGLILIDEEEHFAFHQEQMPHIRAQRIAQFRQELSGCRVILGSRTPSLETLHAAQGNRHALVHLSAKIHRAGVSLLDTTREEGRRFQKTGISSGLEHRIREALQDNTILIFSSQKGSSGTLYCRKCRASIRCPRCSVPLRPHALTHRVICSICGHKEPEFDLCPVCKTSYVRPLGFGIEKVAQELARLFPMARIASNAEPKTDAHDIMIATPAWFEDPASEGVTYDRVIALDPDILWARPDYRSEERAFRRLDALFRRARGELCLQTHLAEHELYKEIGQEHTLFYKRALRERRETNWPPFAGVSMIQIRAAKDKKAQGAALKIHALIQKEIGLNQGIEVFEPGPASPHQVRGKFRYQILIRCRDINAILKPVRKILEKAPSGVIVTFDPEME
jgi:primosomal protein N' (replication factor Y)